MKKHRINNLFIYCLYSVQEEGLFRFTQSPLMTQTHGKNKKRKPPTATPLFWCVSERGRKTVDILLPCCCSPSAIMCTILTARAQASRAPLPIPPRERREIQSRLRALHNVSRRRAGKYGTTMKFIIMSIMWICKLKLRAFQHEEPSSLLLYPQGCEGAEYFQ